MALTISVVRNALCDINNQIYLRKLIWDISNFPYTEEMIEDIQNHSKLLSDRYMHDSFFMTVQTEIDDLLSEMQHKLDLERKEENEAHTLH